VLATKECEASGGGVHLTTTAAGSGTRVLLEGSTSATQAVAFSPLSTFVVTWEKPSPTACPQGNLKVFRATTGAQLACFHMKQSPSVGVAWPAIEWSDDERLALRTASNSVFIYRGSEGWEDGSNLLERVSVPGVTQFSVAPGSAYRFATFVPEAKGKPARCSVYSYPNTATPVTSKSFYQAEEMTTKWSPSGNSVIVFTSTTVDTSGKSYYGSTNLHLMSADGTSEDYSVPLPKEGPVYDVKWNPDPTKPYFIVLSGMMPAQACLYTHKCEQLFLFGEASRNTISFSPSGRFVMLGGFGNLNGGMDFWDLNKRKKMGSNEASIPVGYDWTADSRYFVVSTTAPRMNVDNGVQIFKYNGMGPVGKVAFPQGPSLFECVLKPAARGVYPDRPQSPLRRGEAAAAIPEKKVVAAYRPPGARGGAPSFADRMRAEREGAGVAKKVEASTSAMAKIRVGGAKMPVGFVPEATEKSKTALKKEKAKAKEEADKKRREEEAAALAVLEREKKASPEGIAEEKAKKEKKIKKALKAIDELKAKGGELNDDQKKKLESEAALRAELAAL
jgi:translation initiation factor 2A